MSQLAHVGQAEFKKMLLVSHFGTFYINPDCGLLLRLAASPPPLSHVTPDRRGCYNYLV